MGIPLQNRQVCLSRKKSWHERLTAHIKNALQSRGLLSVNTAKYIKENNKTVDICAKIHIYLTVLITQWERLYKNKTQTAVIDILDLYILIMT